MVSKSIVITGQTATGKTDFAVRLAHELNGELINFDSRQLFKGLDIVSGKDLPKNAQFVTVDQSEFTIGYYIVDSVKVWLYDVAESSSSMTTSDYDKVVSELLNNFFDENKTPIFVGGSYLYLKQLLTGFDVAVKPNQPLRKELNSASTTELQQKLISLDENVFNSLNHSDQNNPHRLIRKIEIVSSGSIKKPITPLISPSRIIGLKHTSQELMQEKIQKRVQSRFENGGVEEVENLMRSNPTPQQLSTLGVKEIIQYLNHEVSKQECLDAWTLREVQYARRQLTFMKQNKSIEWREV